MHTRIGQFKKWLMSTPAYPRRPFAWMWAPHPVLMHPAHDRRQ